MSQVVSPPLAGLAQRLTGRMVDDAEAMLAYRTDQARWVEGGEPAAVVVAHDLDDVVEAIRWASANGVPVVPRGAGSGLSGGAAAIDGCLVLSLERMDRILAVDADEHTALVEPGVINVAVSDAAAPHDLFYPPDPASKAFCTIGGNVATNAGGLCCVRHGVTRDHVLGLEVVLADGSVVWTGRRTVKGVAGYDVTSLMVGSEGTLGVVTKALLRLRRQAPEGPICLATFPSLSAAGGAVASVVRQVDASLLEIVDGRCIRAVEEWRSIGLDTAAQALVFVQTATAADMAIVEAACASADATDVSVSSDAFEAGELLNVRRQVYPALERQGLTLLDDVAVPRAALTTLIARVEEIAERTGADIATFGHAGDGNLHPTIVYAANDPEARATAFEAFGRIVEAALDLHGTCTGEHGVGVLKRSFVPREVGERQVALQRAIKRAFDPAGILNPGRGIA
jgi:glycolate oxidase